MHLSTCGERGLGTVCTTAQCFVSSSLTSAERGMRCLHVSGGMYVSAVCRGSLQMRELPTTLLCWLCIARNRGAPRLAKQPLTATILVSCT
jgi:hypothetical protein